MLLLGVLLFFMFGVLSIQFTARFFVSEKKLNFAGTVHPWNIDLRRFIFICDDGPPVIGRYGTLQLYSETTRILSSKQQEIKGAELIARNASGVIEINVPNECRDFIVEHIRKYQIVLGTTNGLSFSIPLTYQRRYISETNMITTPPTHGLRGKHVEKIERIATEAVGIPR